GPRTCHQSLLDESRQDQLALALWRLRLFAEDRKVDLPESGLGHAAWLIKSAGGQVEKQTRLRAEAAVLLAEGRYEEAAAAASQGLAAAPESADPCGAIAETEWLQSILTAVKQQGPEQHASSLMAREHPIPHETC